MFLLNLKEQFHAVLSSPKSQKCQRGKIEFYLDLSWFGCRLCMGKKKKNSKNVIFLNKNIPRFSWKKMLNKIDFWWHQTPQSAERQNCNIGWKTQGIPDPKSNSCFSLGEEKSIPRAGWMWLSPNPLSPPSPIQNSTNNLIFPPSNKFPCGLRWEMSQKSWFFFFVGFLLILGCV